MEPEALEPAPDPATGGRRFASGLLDALLLLVALGLILGTELAFASEGEIELFAWGWFLLFAPLFFALYHAFGTGATPGQLELRIGLRDTATGERPGLARALLRSYLGFVFIVTVVPAIVDLLSLAGSRSLRDRLTRTSPVHIELQGRATELTGETMPELVPIFEPPPGTRQYLRRGWALLRARPRLVLGTVAALYAVLITVSVILGFLVVADSPDAWTILFYGHLVAMLLMSGAYWTQAAVVVGVEDARVGGPDATVWATLVRASHRVNALTAALMILIPLATLASYLFLPLLLVGRVSMIAPALVLEDTRVFGAYGRSWRLTEGRTMRLFGLYLLSGLVLLGAVFAAMFPAGVVGAANDTAGVVAGLAFGAVALVVALAWLGAAWALVYEDARRAHPPGGAA